MQLVLPVNPEGAQPVNALVSIEVKGGQVAYFAGGVPLFVHTIGDQTGARLAASQLITLKLARKKELAEVLGINRNTLSRQQQKMIQEGVAGLVDKTRGPKGAHKLTGAVLAQVQQCLDEGKSSRQTGVAVGISEGAIRHAMKRGHLRPPLPSGSGMPVHAESKPGEGTQAEPALDPGERAKRAMQNAAGVGGSPS